MIEEFQGLVLNQKVNNFDKKIKNISREIEELKFKEPKLNYIECVVEVCESHDIDYESLKKVLSTNIKEKLEMEAMELNLLKYKNNTLV